MPPVFFRCRLRMLAAGTLAITLTGCVATGPASPPGRQRVLLEDGQARIDVIVEGRGPAVVLLPSSQRDSEDFDDLAERLAADGFKVLRPQPRGMGRSTGPMQGLNLHVLAADVAATVRQLGEGRAVLVGHAFGHFVARVADLDHPQMVRGVVVAGGGRQGIPAQRRAVPRRRFRSHAAA